MVWQSTANPTLMERAQAYADDPQIFDIRREMGALRVTIEELVVQLDKDRANLSLVNALKSCIDSLSQAQIRGIQVMAAKQFYLTVAQAEKILRDLGIIWAEEVDKLAGEHPEFADKLHALRLRCVQRLGEVELPQLPTAVS